MAESGVDARPADDQVRVDAGGVHLLQVFVAVDLIAEVAAEGSAIAELGHGHGCVGSGAAAATQKGIGRALLVRPRLVVNRKNQIVASMADAENIDWVHGQCFQVCKRQGTRREVRRIVNCRLSTFNSQCYLAIDS